MCQKKQVCDRSEGSHDGVRGSEDSVFPGELAFDPRELSASKQVLDGSAYRSSVGFMVVRGRWWVECPTGADGWTVAVPGLMYRCTTR
jgi:hypothetical protein